MKRSTNIGFSVVFSAPVSAVVNHKAFASVRHSAVSKTESEQGQLEMAKEIYTVKPLHVYELGSTVYISVM